MPSEQATPSMELFGLSYVWSNDTDTFIGVPMSCPRAAGKTRRATTEAKVEKRMTATVENNLACDVEGAGGVLQQWE